MSSMLIATCPRCGQVEMTLDVRSYVTTFPGGSDPEYEVFCRCRHCGRSSIHDLKAKNNTVEPTNYQSTINYAFHYRGFVRTSGIPIKCPEHVPEDVKLIFDEGARCLANANWNAAGSMFRKVVDRVSKARLPAESDANGPNNHTRFNLKARLIWLFENGLLSRDIEPLAEAIREDGNDAVHDHPIDEAEARDLADFTVELLEGVFTMPGRLKAASDRREARRAPKQ